MDYTTCYCRSPQCPMYGQMAPGAQVKMHDWQRQGPWFRCARGGANVSATTGTRMVKIFEHAFPAVLIFSLSSKAATGKTITDRLD
jgi:hypothetical protein